MTSRLVDAGVVQGFLEAVSPESVPVAMRVLDQIEYDLAGQRRQRELNWSKRGMKHALHNASMNASIQTIVGSERTRTPLE